MVDHGWFSYWHNLCHNATLDHGWQLMIMVVTMWRHTKRQSLLQCDHDYWPWLTMVYFHIDIIFVIMWHCTMFHNEWPWLMIIDNSWPWLIFILIQCLSQCDVGQCLTIFGHAYKPKRIILNPEINIINPMNSIIP